MEYANGDPSPEDAESVKAVIEYLKALNSFFELSILGSKVRIFKSDGSTLQRMEKGFAYFKQWCEDAISHGMGTTNNITHSNLYSYVNIGAFEESVDDKNFISWQVCFSFGITNSELVWC